MNRLMVVSGFALVAALVVSCASPIPCDACWHIGGSCHFTCDLGPNNARRD